jgi:hypothetical protein
MGVGLVTGFIGYSQLAPTSVTVTVTVHDSALSAVQYGIRQVL